jgi:phospholipase/carboxylesterase
LKFSRKGVPLGQAKSLVIFLHGYGADGSDLLGLADVLAPQLPGTAFVAPDAPDACAMSAFGRQWFPIPRFDGSSEIDSARAMNVSVQDLNAFIDARLAAEGLAIDRLVLVGFSQGAMMALHLAPRRDVAMAGVVAISGRLLVAGMLASEARAKPPVLLIHGDRDDVVDFSEMQLAGNALVAAGFSTFGHVMQGSGHTIAPDGLGVAMQFLKDRLQ